LALAAKERAAADAADPGRVADDQKSHASDHGPSNVNDALLYHKAAAVLNLHAQAVAVTNIRSLIPIVLNRASTNYCRWRDQFLLVVGKYSLQRHVLFDDTAPEHPD
jgi:hypothetical protein